MDDMNEVSIPSNIAPGALIQEQSIQWLVPEMDKMIFVQESFVACPFPAGRIDAPGLVAGWSNLRRGALPRNDGFYDRRVFWYALAECPNQLTYTTVDPTSVLPSIPGANTPRMRRLIASHENGTIDQVPIDNNFNELIRLNGLDCQKVSLL